MSEIIKVAITKFDSNPYQPATRVKVPEETQAFFGKSILEHGLLQIPIARQAPFGKAGEHYQMADGWLRLQGHQWLVANGHPEFQEIQVDIRELTDEQMAQLLFEANGIRKNLDPIEKAQYFKKCIDDFKFTEKQLADKLRISQGEVANTLRLLQLPETLQEEVAEGKVPQTHARHLLRLNAKPEEQKKITQEVIKGSISVNELSSKIDETLWRDSKSLNPKADGYLRPKFDVAVCSACVSYTMATDPSGSKKKEARCINVKCWEEKQLLAESTETAEQVMAAKEAGDKFIYTPKTVPGGEYNFLDEITIRTFDSSACATCAKTGNFKYDLKDAEEEVQRICLDAPCMRAKKSAFSRDKNKADKIMEAELTETLGKLFHQIHNRPTAAMLLLARYTLNVLDHESSRDIMRIFPSLPKTAQGVIDRGALITDLPTKTIEELTDLAVAMAFTSQRRSQRTSSQYSTEILEPLAFDYTTLKGGPVVKQAVTEVNNVGEPLVTTETAPTLELPCVSCANEATCSKEHFHVHPDEKRYVCENKVEKVPATKVVKYCSPAVLKSIVAINSAASLSEEAPKLKGFFQFEESFYTCVGELTEGNKLLRGLCWEIVESDKFTGETIIVSQSSGGYNGVWGTYKGKEYVLVGNGVDFVPQSGKKK